MEGMETSRPYEPYLTPVTLTLLDPVTLTLTQLFKIEYIWNPIPELFFCPHLS